MQKRSLGGLSYGLGGAVIDWFTSYLGDRTQYVCCGQFSLKILQALFGVPQRSVLRLILFLLYIADLLRLIAIRNFHPHLFTDDAQIYGFCRPGGTDDLQGRLSDCVSDVASWMRSKIAYISTLRRLRCSGARLFVASIRFQPHQSWSARLP